MDIHQYTMSLNLWLEIGTEKTFDIKDWTLCDFMLNNIISNSICPNFIILESVCIDNLELLNDGIWDSYTLIHGRVG